MPNASLEIALPEGSWMHGVSTAHPESTFRVVTVHADGDTAIGLVELASQDPASVVANMVEREEVRELDLLWTNDGEALVQFRTSETPLLLPALRAGVALETPFDVRDGRATWEITTSSDRLSELGSRLDEAGIQYDIDYVREFGEEEADRLLTDRQRELLTAGLEDGYYDTPRRTTLTDLAERHGIAKATASDVLHRAEGNVLTWFAEEHLSGR